MRLLLIDISRKKKKNVVSDSIPLTRHVNIPYTVFTYILVNDFHDSRYLYAKLTVKLY